MACIGLPRIIRSACTNRSPGRVVALRSSTRPAGARNLSFSFAGPRTLDDIIKTDLVSEKSGKEIEDMWYAYHDQKQDVVAEVLSGEDGTNVLARAKECPFFVQPIFRDSGFFMLVSQFQPPSHFLLAYLEDFKMDPNSATPLLTFSVFNDFVPSKDVSLVRCDITNRAIQGEEGHKVVQNLLDSYRLEDKFQSVRAFNLQPDTFDIDDYISRMNETWKSP